MVVRHNRIDFSGMTFEQLGNCGGIPNVEVIMVITANAYD